MELLERIDGSHGRITEMRFKANTFGDEQMLQGLHNALANGYQIMLLDGERTVGVFVNGRMSSQGEQEGIE